MALNASQPYQNGKPKIPMVKISLNDQKTGWIDKNGVQLYAERYEPDRKLMIKTLHNKKNADATVLRVRGKRSLSWPFTIIKI
ncbi:MAG: hypothetical protein M5Z89_08530 [Olivibacter sp.]|nr:hypothetical protein [Olivibacter sp. UJ_SKK_5.1]